MKEETKEYSEIATNWQTLRSQLYLHHRGICWICHEPIELQDYEVGHLVDRCNGGKDAIENVAPMHKWCNNSKPRHNTLEEHITWLLKTKWLEQKPVPQFHNMPSATNKPYPYRRNHDGTKQKTRLSVIDLEANRALFEPIPALQNTSDAIKLEVIKLLSKVLDTPTETQKEATQSRITDTLQKTQDTNSQLPQIEGLTRHTYRKQPNYSIPHKTTTPKPAKAELLAKIVPHTICWVQGRPVASKDGYAPMWKILPPPYKQEDLFAVRQLPPGAVDKDGDIRNTLQFIGGTPPHEIDTTITLGWQTYHITFINDQLSITFQSNNQSNNRKGSQTVGMGTGQIPLAEWRKAKAQGITFRAFVDNYPQA